MRLQKCRLIASATCLLLGILASALPSLASYSEHIVLVNRLTWGANASTMTEFVSKGKKGWLAAELGTGDDHLPSEVQARVDALVSSVDLPTRLFKADRLAVSGRTAASADERLQSLSELRKERVAAAKMAASRAILRALYGHRQLKERLAWFWFNHFNVFQGKANIEFLIDDYIEHAIRPNVLGNFRTLLYAVATHPAMLRYLDNVTNSSGGINENYARELIELHTLGADGGYSQMDVEQLARVLTGAMVNVTPAERDIGSGVHPGVVRRGLFIFNPRLHVPGDKQLLGRIIEGRGFDEIEAALDVLSRHPSTARHISRKMAEYFFGIAPPIAMLNRMSTAFHVTDGDITAVMEAMIASPEFLVQDDHQFKDPTRYVLSAVRLAYDGQFIVDTSPVERWLKRLGQSLFARTLPDGYPVLPSAWNGPGQIVARFDVAKQISEGSYELFGASLRPRMQDAFYDQWLSGQFSANTRATLHKAVSPEDWNFLFLASPEFMR